MAVSSPVASSSTTISSTTTTPSNLPTTLHNLQNCFPHKLKNDNYRIWRTQVIPQLKGVNVFGYVDGSTPAPSKTISMISEDGTLHDASNPEYHHWHLQDQLILGALISSLEESLITHVMTCLTSQDVWVTLERMFLAQSQASFLQKHLQLTNLKKGNSSITEYFHKFTGLVDTLAAIDKPLSDVELTSFLLGGLGSEFNPFVTSVTTGVDPLKIEEIYGHLLAYEQHMEINQPSVDISTGSANFATKRGPPRGGRGGRSHYSHSFGRGFPTNTSYGRNFRGRGRGRGPSNSFYTTKSICQICRKPGHEAPDCYRRFDNSSPHDSTAFMEPQAHYASQHAPPDQAWYPDSGATHHLTPDLNNLTLNAADYTGSDQICMGNGNGLAIEHIGDTQLTSPTTSFLLQNVLHVPLITKNLLSVHKFTLETNTYIEFHPWFFLVKEQGSGKILLQGLNDGGLYKLPPSISPNSTPSRCSPSSSSSPSRYLRRHQLNSSSASSALVGERTSLGSWHSRLGHPALRICTSVLSQFKLPVFKNNAPMICPACHISKSKQLSFPLSLTRVNHPLELIYTDVWGPSPICSSAGNKYYISFLDAYSRYTWLFPMSNKSDACNIFIQFQKNVERSFNTKIKILQSD
jgi:hypothetical protein